VSLYNNRPSSKQMQVSFIKDQHKTMGIDLGSKETTDVYFSYHRMEFDSRILSDEHVTEHVPVVANGDPPFLSENPAFQTLTELESGQFRLDE